MMRYCQGHREMATSVIVHEERKLPGMQKAMKLKMQVI